MGELAGYICSHLQRNGIRVVLSGGAAVSIHSGSRYQSFDLDFIENVASGRQQSRKVLKEIGFVDKARYFVHSEAEFFLDFPAGPLAVGREPVKDIEEMDFPTGKLNILSPTASRSTLRRLPDGLGWKARALNSMRSERVYSKQRGKGNRQTSEVRSPGD